MVELFTKLIIKGRKKLSDIKSEKLRNSVRNNLFNKGYDEEGNKI